LPIFIYCSPGNEKDREWSIFRYNESNGISSLDPAFARNLENISAVNHLFNGLVQMDEELKVQPCIAKKWEVSDSGRVYIFTLRDDVYFHPHPLFQSDSNRKVTASDFVFSFNRIRDENLASPGAWVFNFVAVDEKGKSRFTAVNDSVLRIELIHAFPPFLGILCMQYCSVVPSE